MRERSLNSYLLWVDLLRDIGGTVNYFFDRPLVRRSSSSVQDRFRMLVRDSDFMSNRPSLSFRISLRREARVGSSCDEAVFLFVRFI